MDQSRRSFLKKAAYAIAGRTTLGRAAAESPSPGELAAMEAVASAFMQAHSAPGLSVAIARHGELVYEKGFGFADREAQEQMTPSHLFRIASISKPITSVAVFRLIEQGRLTLDDTVFGSGGLLGNDFGQSPFQPFVEQIRVSHLLTHTCGGWQNDRGDPMFKNPRMNHRELIAWTLENLPLTHPPGERYAYSNFGYCIVGRIVEKLTGQSYERHVQDAVLNRCGVSAMRIGGNTAAERAPGEVVYYGAPGQNPYGMNVRRMDSHGGWLARASDLARFATHVDAKSSERDILQPATIREMTTPTAANAHYAKGWMLNEAHTWWHTGSLPGTATILVRTASGFCWAALTNTREASGATGAALDKMMWQMARQVWDVR